MGFARFSSFPIAMLHKVFKYAKVNFPAQLGVVNCASLNEPVSHQMKTTKMCDIFEKHIHAF